MLKAVIELSKYILVINILLYTLISYILLRRDDGERKSVFLVLQDLLILINHLTGSLVLLSSRQDLTFFIFSAAAGDRSIFVYGTNAGNLSAV